MNKNTKQKVAMLRKEGLLKWQPRKSTRPKVAAKRQ